jgi:hypothetical protein
MAADRLLTYGLGSIGFVYEKIFRDLWFYNWLIS